MLFFFSLVNMKWKAEPILHKGDARIALHFDYSKEANERVRKLAGVKWSRTLKVWHVPDKDVYRAQFKLPTRNITAQQIATKKENILHLTAEEQNRLLAYENLLRVKSLQRKHFKELQK